MSTGKNRFQAAWVTSILFVASCQSEIEPSATNQSPTAWWYNLDIDPQATSLFGQRPETIDAQWHRAEPLTIERLQSKVSGDEIKELRASPLSLSVDTDLDKDGTTEYLFVGIYRTNDGTSGRFVAIRKNDQIVAHFNETTDDAFSALLSVENEVRWYKCLQCGEFESIRWSGDSYVLE